MAIDTIGTNAIANDAVTAAKIPAGAVDADITAIPDGSVTTAKLAADAVTAAKLADNSVVTANVTDGAITQVKTTGVGRGRNLIINGAMHVAQRDNASGVTAHTYAGPDRMRLLLDSGGTYSISQNTDVPTGQGFYHSYKLNCTSAVAFGGAGDNVHLRMGSLESRDCQQFAYGTSNAKKLTLSFWIKVQYADTFNAALVNHDAQRSNFRPFTISSANTWQKVTLTYDGDTNSGDGFNDDGGLGLSVDLWLGSGSNFTGGSATANNWDERANNNTSLVAASTKFGTSTNHELYITGIQLELGDQATDFDHRLISETLQLCQRYYMEFNPNNAAYDFICLSYGLDSDDIIGVINLPCAMRASPTLTSSNLEIFIGSGGGTDTADQAIVGYSLVGPSNQSSLKTSLPFNIDTDGSPSITAGYCYPVGFRSESSGYLRLNAEF